MVGVRRPRRSATAAATGSSFNNSSSRWWRRASAVEAGGSRDSFPRPRRRRLAPRAPRRLRCAVPCPCRRAKAPRGPLAPMPPGMCLGCSQWAATAERLEQRDQGGRSRPFPAGDTIRSVAPEPSARAVRRSAVVRCGRPLSARGCASGAYRGHADPARRAPHRLRRPAHSAGPRLARRGSPIAHVLARRQATRWQRGGAGAASATRAQVPRESARRSGARLASAK